jgi:3-polyprenyl-4-hydroxybenzoate decarboxylase
MQFYIPVTPNHVMRVTAVPRRDPIFRPCTPARPRTRRPGHPAQAQLYREIAAAGVDVREVSLTPTILGAPSRSGSARGRAEAGDGRRVGRYRWPVCVVVDDDVNVFDAGDVVGRSRPGRDSPGLFHVPMRPAPRDPHGMHAGKLIDATIPLGVGRAHKRRAPGRRPPRRFPLGVARGDAGECATDSAIVRVLAG